MNFFEQQDIARKNTFRLVILYALAVLTLIALTSLLVLVLFSGAADPESPPPTPEDLLRNFLHISLFVISVVIIGAVYKIFALRGGGVRIAEMMGGELVVSGTGDFNKQKVLNVVEEMAIAAGTPVPPVYLIDEAGINAFAAGYQPGDAVVGVTRGCIEQLSREELQGVIAHEFSHILNGDMRLNIRLIGILHGILVIGLIGYWILRASSGRSSSKEGGGGLALLGLGLIVIGFAGTFFGDLIKSAVSRQREYLADASAVQFTRSPKGIAGALKRIGGFATQGELDHPVAHEISHALFCSGVSNFLGRLSATHPPLDDRIRRIQPDWDGEFLAPVISEQPAQEPEEPNSNDATKKDRLAAMVLATGGLQSFAVDDTIGNPTEQHLTQARQMLADMPDILTDATHEQHGARALIHFLVLDDDAEMRARQMDFLSQNAERGVFDAVNTMVTEVSELPVEFRLPLIDMALPTLRQLSKSQYQTFHTNLSALIDMDNEISLFEWTVQKIVFHHLDTVFNDKPLQRGKSTTLKKSVHACSVLLSTLAWAGEQQDIGEQRALAAANAHFKKCNVELLDRSALDYQQLGIAMDELARLKPLEKSDLLHACAACINADQQVTIAEIELFRAVASLLDCPVPPLLRAA